MQLRFLHVWDVVERGSEVLENEEPVCSSLTLKGEVSLRLQVSLLSCIWRNQRLVMLYTNHGNKMHGPKEGKAGRSEARKTKPDQTGTMRARQATAEMA